MRLFLAIVIGLVVLGLLWKLLHWALGLAMGLLWIAAIAAALLFVAGLVRRLIRH
jgi:hypothetical protein